LFGLLVWCYLVLVHLRDFIKAYSATWSKIKR
jgi:hypothetical protein